MKRWSVVAACAYVALAGSGWMLELASPNPVPASERQILVFVLVLAAGLLGRPQWSGLRGSQVWRAAGAGLLLSGLPNLLSPVLEGGLPAFTRVALLALTPAAVVLVTTSRESGGFDLLTLLTPSLAGVAGAFLLLPAEPALLLERPVAAAAMAATILSIAVGSYAAHAAVANVPMRVALVLLLAPNVALMAVRAALIHRAMAMPAVSDVPGVIWGAAEISLLIYLLQRLPPIVLSGRYFLVPLVTAVEGLALVRPAVSVRVVLGVALMGLGAAGLAARGRRGPDSPRSLLG